MNSKYKPIITLLLLSFLCLNLINNNFADGFKIAIGPGVIRENNALRNHTYIYTLFIYNQNDIDNYIFLNLTGNVRNWGTFYEYGNSTNPINSTFVNKNTDKPIRFILKIPSSAANNEYLGHIIVTAKPIETNTSGNVSSLQLSSASTVSINVTGDQEKNVTIEKMYVDDVEMGDIARFRINLINKGNVVVSPQIKISVFNKEGILLDRLSSIVRFIEPGNIHRESMRWNTTGKISGTYTANFNITLDEKTIENKNISFEIYPEGTFTRNGTLKSIKYSGTLEKEKFIKIIATFKNTGEVKTKAKFLGNVYLNNELINTIESQELFVDKYEEESFESSLELKEDGEYLIQGYVLFDGRKTETLNLKFTVGLVSSINSIQLLGIFILMIIGVGIISYYLKRKKNASFGFSKDKPVKVKKEKIKKIKKEKPLKLKTKEKKTKKDKKPKTVDFGNMSAKEIEDYVKGLW